MLPLPAVGALPSQGSRAPSDLGHTEIALVLVVALGLALGAAASATIPIRSGIIPGRGWRRV
jgi:hypothetical protein